MVSADEDNSFPSPHRVLLRKAIVQAARRRRDWTAFEQRIERLETLDDPDAQLEALYERCLRARDELDYKSLMARIHQLTGHDPIWSLRRAALAAVVGDHRTATSLILDARDDIRSRQANDPHSLWLLSREAWTSWLTNIVHRALRDSPSESTQEWPSRYRAHDTDPWDELHAIDREMSDFGRRLENFRHGRRPTFDAGTYTLQNIVYEASMSYSNLVGLADHVGIPVWLGAVNIIGSRMTEALRIADGLPDDGIWSYAQLIAGDPGVDRMADKWFDRVRVACMPLGLVKALAEKLLLSVDFGKKRIATVLDDGVLAQDVHWINRVGNMLDLMSRLSARYDSDSALNLFRLGVALAHDLDPFSWILHNGLRNFLCRSLRAVAPDRRQEVALGVLDLPTHWELPSAVEPDRWSTVVEVMGQEWGRRWHAGEWSSHVNDLISDVEEGAVPARTVATHKLVRLFAGDALTEGEAYAFGRAIWQGASANGGGLPTGTDLLPHVFVHLPSPDPGLARVGFDAEVVDQLAKGAVSENCLRGLFGASVSLRGEYHPYSLDQEKAVCILSALIGWKPPFALSPPGYDTRKHEEKKILELIGKALAYTVLPSLQRSDIHDGDIKTMLDRVADQTVPEMLIPLPALVRIVPKCREAAVTEIGRGLRSGNGRIVNSALGAVVGFIKFAEPGQRSVPKRCVDGTVNVCLMRRNPGLVFALDCVRELVAIGEVSELHRRELSASLVQLRKETSYRNWVDRLRSPDVGLIRQGAVRLADELRRAGCIDQKLIRWIEEAKKDPLPEVRYALPDKQRRLS